MKNILKRDSVQKILKQNKKDDKDFAPQKTESNI